MRLNGNTIVFGILGDPVEHSLSPLMQTRVMEKMGLNGVYVPFHVTRDRLEDAIRGIRALGIRGVNVTVPYKTGVIPFLDRVTDTARAIGAVNTIVNDDGVLTGENTDVYGFMQGLATDPRISAIPARVCILGAGGAARSVVYGLAVHDDVREIVIVNRTPEHAERLASEFTGSTGKAITARPAEPAVLAEELAAAGLVVNTTTLGMHPNVDATPVADPGWFREGQIVYDIVVPPVETRLLREAAVAGTITVNALPMLVWQGARALFLWTGREAPVVFMIDTVYDHFRVTDMN